MTKNMKTFHRILAFLAAVLCAGLFFGCSETIDEIGSLDLKRCLEPMNLTAKVTNGDQVTFGWDVTKDATQYNLVVYTDKEMTQEFFSTTLDPSQVPYTKALEADATYYYKVQATSANGLDDSNWAVYEKSIKTYAVKDNLYLKVTDRAAGSVSLAWSTAVGDYLDVERIEYRKPTEETASTYELSSSDISSGTATVTGLTPSTEYVFTLYFKSAARGEVNAWTTPDINGTTSVASLAELQNAVKTSGAKILLSNSGSPYLIDIMDIANGVSILGEGSADGSMPVLQGEIHMVDTWANGDALYFEGVQFDGVNGTYGFPIQKKNGGAADNIQISSIIFKNCVITGYSKGLIYEWSKTMTIGELTWDSCDINNINSDGSGGGDVIDFRGASTVSKLNLVNNTIYQGMRTSIRIDNGTWGDIKVENNTLMNLCFVDNANNAGIFGLQVQPSSLSFKNNLFLNMVDKATLGSANAKYKTASDLGVAAGNNWFYNIVETFFTDSWPLSAVKGTMLDADPCYNAKGGYFNLTNTDLSAAKAGASKWWTAYVEEPEDLTLDCIEGSHTWDLANARYFSGTYKKSAVRDGMMIVASGDCPVAFEDGTLNFQAATVTNKKNLPKDGYIVFKVKAPGSVVIKPVGGETSHVIIGTSPVENPTTCTIKGGVASLAESTKAQKVVISDITEETLVYVFCSGPIGISQLAWSEDVSAVNTALPAPNPTAAPETVTAGDEKEITVSWEPVENAASYSVVFSGKTYSVDEGTSYTISSSIIKMLDAGVYSVSVYANPGPDDIYNTESEVGKAAFAVLPKSEGGGSTEFIVSTVEELMTAISAGKDAITLKYSDTPYAIGNVALTAPLHLTGQTSNGRKTSLTGNFTLSGNIGGSVVVNNVEVVGDGTSFFVEDKTNGPAADTVALYNSNLRGTKALYDNSGKAVSDVQYLIFKGNIFDNCSPSADFIDLRTGAHHNFIFVNNTVANSCRTFIRTDAAHEMNYATIRNNTFYKVATIESSKDNNGIFHIRSAAGSGLLSYKVQNNLFYSILIDTDPSNAAGFPKFKSKTGIVPATVMNNYFYNCEDREERAAYSFFAYMTKEQCLTGGGAILPADPCKDAANGDFTLTNGVAMNANVGDPRWNPARGSAPTSEITVSNVEELLTAISAGKTVITLSDGEYDFTAISESTEVSAGKATLVNTLTIMGGKGAVLKGGFQLNSGVGNFTIKGITLDGASSVDNALYVMDKAGIGTITLFDVTVRNFKNRLLYQDKETSSVSSVVINRATVTDMGTSGDFIDFRKGTLNALKVMNSTFANGIRTFLRMDAAVVCNSVQVTNNTFYNLCSVDSKDNNGVFHVRSTSVTDAAQVIVRNNLFASMHRASESPSNANGFPKLVSKTSAAIKVPTFIHNYYYGVDTADEAYSWWSYMTEEAGTAGNGVVLSADPFQGAASGDFTLVNALAASENIGDARWNTNRQKYIGPQFEVSDTTTFFEALSAGKTDILVTADLDFSGHGAIAVNNQLSISGKISHGKKPVVNANFTLSGSKVPFTLYNLNLDGKNALSDMIVLATEANLTALNIKDCDITGYKNRLISGPNASACGPVSVVGNIVTGMGTGGDFIDFRKGTVTSIKVVNNTFANGIRTFLRVDAAVFCGAVNVENNTFYNIGSVDSKDNNGIMHVRSSSATAMPRQITVRKNIFAAMHKAAETPSNANGFPKLVSTASAKIAVPYITDNYFFDIDTTEGYSWWNTLTTDQVTAAGTVLTETPFTGDTASGKFTVATAYKGYGDCRW